MPFNYFFVTMFSGIHSDPPFHGIIIVYPASDIIDKSKIHAIIPNQIPAFLSRPWRELELEMLSQLHLSPRWL